MTVHCIMTASITRHAHRTTARVTYMDTHKHPHELIGAYPGSARLLDLLLRATREGVTVTREEF